MNTINITNQAETPLNIFRYSGAKWSIARDIIKLFPGHKTYVEPYLGSGAIFFTKQPSKIEVLNDINDDVINFFNVLRTQGKELKEQLKLIPYARHVYYSAYTTNPQTDIEKAINFFIKTWMGFGGTYHHKRGFKSSIDPTGPNTAGVFKRVVENLDWYIDRLRDSHIEKKNALDIIEVYGRHEDTVIYIDPPYVPGTRKKYLYKHEADDQHHVQLLEIIKKCNCKIILSGYESQLYNKELSNWDKMQFKSWCSANTNMSTQDRKRTETIWSNFRLCNSEQLRMEESGCQS